MKEKSHFWLVPQLVYRSRFIDQWYTFIWNLKCLRMIKRVSAASVQEKLEWRKINIYDVKNSAKSPWLYFDCKNIRAYEKAFEFKYTGLMRGNSSGFILSISIFHVNYLSRYWKIKFSGFEPKNSTWTDTYETGSQS